MYIDVSMKATSNVYKATELLQNLPPIIGLDFEVANKLSEKEKALKAIKARYSGEMLNEQELNADGLSHPSLSTITHLSIGVSDSEGIVLVCDNQKMIDFVYHFLTTTEIHQIWHNALFDFRHILYNTGKLPKVYDDTMLLYKCLYNNADSTKCKAGLKAIQGYKYGDWAIAKEMEFTKANMHNEKMLLYAATDACATLDLYNNLIK